LAQFDEHISQANKNLLFLQFINKANFDCYDWQVTVCFYCALHIVNAHLSLHQMQYRKHVDVKDALNPKNPLSVNKGSALPEKEYLAYTKLQSLSRRSRYLVNEKDNNLGSDKAAFTYDIHLQRALRHLNTLINYFKKSYNISVSKIQLKCTGINSGELCFAET
jgi:hypothetical protein